MKKVEIKLLNDEVVPPNYTKVGDAGMDIRADIVEPYVLKPNESKLFPTGFAIYINDENVFAMLVPRSGLGSKHGIVLGNLSGIIDSSYQGEVKVCLWNRSQVEYTVNPGDRIAQMIFLPVVRVEYEVVDEFTEESDRGTSGFGSSGVK